MKLEQNDTPFLFSSTSLPDVFFTEYLSYADGNYVKIYLAVFVIGCLTTLIRSTHERKTDRRNQQRHG